MEEIEKSLRVSFCGAANSVSQLYVQSLHLQKQSYISGYQKAVEQMMQFAASKAYKTTDTKIVLPLEELMLFCNRQLQSLQVESGPQQSQSSSLQSTPPSTPSIPLQNPENTEMSQTHNRQISELNQPSLYSASSQNEHQQQQQQQQQHYVNNHQQQQMVNQQDFISSNSSDNQNFSTDFKEGGRKRPIGFTFEPPSSLNQNGHYNTGTPTEQQQAFPFFYHTEQVAKRGRFELPISQQ